MLGYATLVKMRPREEESPRMALHIAEHSSNQSFPDDIEPIMLNKGAMEMLKADDRRTGFRVF